MVQDIARYGILCSTIVRLSFFRQWANRNRYTLRHGQCAIPYQLIGMVPHPPPNPIPIPYHGINGMEYPMGYTIHLSDQFN